jgi:hypothetical protein
MRLKKSRSGIYEMVTYRDVSRFIDPGDLVELQSLQTHLFDDCESIIGLYISGNIGEWYVLCKYNGNMRVQNFPKGWWQLKII